MSGAREAMLAALRLAAAAAPCPPLPPPLPAGDVPPGERVARFLTMLQLVGGAGELVPDWPAAAARAAALCTAAGARTIAASDAPELAAVRLALAPGVRWLTPDAPRAEQLAADVGLCTAQWGIAATGTLVLDAAAERHRLASLLPPQHIALLPRSRLLGTLGQALLRLRPAAGPLPAGAITFVTGPSRTADIELELVVGVHGPGTLHVLLVDSA